MLARVSLTTATGAVHKFGMADHIDVYASCAGSNTN